MELPEQEEVAPPKLRFKASGSYRSFLLSDLCTFSLGRQIKQGEASPEFETPCVRYGELYHMYGEVIDTIFNRTNLDRSELLFSHGDEILLPSAGEDPMDIGSASALTLKDVAIGRTINILRPLHPDTYSHKYVAYYIREKLRERIAALAQGVSISNVYNTQLRTLEVKLPALPEQEKITTFLGAVDRKIQQLNRKRTLLEQYKKGAVQQLFSQELRFKRKDGGEYPEWEDRELKDVLTEHKLSSTGKEEVYSVSVHKSLINQVEHLGRVYAAESTEHYNRVLPGDIVYTKSPTGEFKYGIIKQSRLDKSVIVSPLYGVFTPETRALGYWLDAYFESILNTYNYLHPIVQKGAKNTIAVTNRTFLSNTLKLPVSKEEQEKIAGFLMALDAKVANVANAVEAAQRWKKGLLQQMFV